MNSPFLAALLAATALSGGLAWADPKDDHGGGGGGGHPQAQHQAPAQHQLQGRTQGFAQPQAQHQPQARTQGFGQTQARTQGYAQPQARGQGVAPSRGGGGFSYGGRQHAQIQGPAFSYPQGYGYRHWGVGENLPLMFLSSLYFFDSYADYGIGAPPYGYRWVRYGPDLLLVSNRTGRIRRVIYGVFY
jgi:Ni/Co efflux regulator RcnB